MPAAPAERVPQQGRTACIKPFDRADTAMLVAGGAEALTVEDDFLGAAHGGPAPGGPAPALFVIRGTVTQKPEAPAIVKPFQKRAGGVAGRDAGVGR